MMNKKEEKKATKGNSNDVRSNRIKAETDRKLLAILKRLNSKEFGRKLRADDVIKLSISLLKDEHFKKLQDTTLTNTDRLELLYKQHSSKDKNITRDSFIGLVLAGKIDTSAGAGLS